MMEKNEIVVRRASMEDKEAFRRLWQICFGDSDAFCDWFFTHRFRPEYSDCLTENGALVSCMQAFPYRLSIRGKEIPAAMLCGVSTHPEHRKRGYMDQIFRFEMELLRKEGFLTAAHTPAVLPSYFAYGHLPAADASYLESECVPSYASHEGFLIGEKDWEKLYPLYCRFSEKYSGIIKRTLEDHLRKCADYAADGGKCVVLTDENDEITGYCFFYLTDTELIGAEAAAEEGCYGRLAESLFSIAEGRSFSMKLPPRVVLEYPFAKTVTRPKGVMGLLSVQGLLQALSLDIPYAFSVTDDVVKENNGTFFFNGEKTEEAPVFSIDAGHLMQVLLGYRSLSELKDEIKRFDEPAFCEIDRLLPKCNCYIIDEY